jgi:hypothetical protein
MNKVDAAYTVYQQRKARVSKKSMIGRVKNAGKTKVAILLDPNLLF